MPRSKVTRVCIPRMVAVCCTNQRVKVNATLRSRVYQPIILRSNVLVTDILIADILFSVNSPCRVSPRSHHRCPTLVLMYVLANYNNTAYIVNYPTPNG